MLCFCRRRMILGLSRQPPSLLSPGQTALALSRTKSDIRMAAWHKQLSAYILFIRIPVEEMCAARTDTIQRQSGSGDWSIFGWPKRMNSSDQRYCLERCVHSTVNNVLCAQCVHAFHDGILDSLQRIQDEYKANFDSVCMEWLSGNLQKANLLGFDEPLAHTHTHAHCARTDSMDLRSIFRIQPNARRSHSTVSWILFRLECGTHACGTHACGHHFGAQTRPNRFRFVLHFLLKHRTRLNPILHNNNHLGTFSEMGTFEPFET